MFKNPFFGFFFVKSYVICVGYITDSNARCKMSNWGLEILEEQLRLLKRHNYVHIHLKNEDDPWCLLLQFSQLLLGRISKVRSVLKSLEPADFKTDLTFWIWWRFEVVIANKTKKKKFWETPFTLILPRILLKSWVKYKNVKSFLYRIFLLFWNS